MGKEQAKVKVRRPKGTEESIQSCIELLKGARNMEARKAFHAEHLELTKIADIYRGDSKKELYRDSNGSCWYETFYIKNKKVISEYEHIFGRPERSKKRIVYEEDGTTQIPETAGKERQKEKANV
ncbi:MAG: hypothetical protein Q4B01_03965 [Eubacteriales bacterium]|nr:hypothetical protein [Eubacteriales bacterium]